MKILSGKKYSTICILPRIDLFNPVYMMRSIIYHNTISILNIFLQKKFELFDQKLEKMVKSRKTTLRERISIQVIRNDGRIFNTATVSPYCTGFLSFFDSALRWAIRN